MAESKEEYLLWDQRFEFGYGFLNRRLNTTEGAVQQISELNEQLSKQLAASTKQMQKDNSSLRGRIQQLEQTTSRIPKLDEQIHNLAASTKQLQEDNSSLRDRNQQLEQISYRIPQLDEQIQDLAASTKQLQEDNSSLRDRIQQLEQTSDRIPQLDEQIQDLAASNSDLKEQSNVSNNSIFQIEQEGTHRDQENQLVREQLKEKVDVLEQNLGAVAAAMRGMNEMAGLERAQRGNEMKHLKSQVEDLVATRHTTGGYARGASREISRATTEDERIPVNNHAEQQQAAQEEFEAQGVLIKAQTSSTLFENHLNYAEKAFKQCETEAVLAFVSSVHEKHRITLENRLEKHGEWTWQAVMEEAYAMVEAEKRIPRRSARLLDGPAQRT